LADSEFWALTEDPSALERFSVEKSVGASPMPFAVLKSQESSIASLPTVSFFAYLQRFAPQRLQRVPAATGLSKKFQNINVRFRAQRHPELIG
jgi:hypothetical protein